MFLKGSYDTTGTAWATQVVGNLAYVADGSSGLEILDISKPSAPILKGHYTTASDAYSVQVSGGNAANWCDQS
jgi:hypothetical protein